MLRSLSRRQRMEKKSHRAFRGNHRVGRMATAGF
jgi:hypothetical protein